MVEAAEKQQLPEAPISITVMAYYAGFQVLITRRTGEQPIISQVPGIVALVNKLVEAGFEPVRETAPPALPNPETNETGKESSNPTCQIHHASMVWKEGVKDNRHYAFGLAHKKIRTDRFANIALENRHPLIQKLIIRDWHTRLHLSRVFNASHLQTLRY